MNITGKRYNRTRISKNITLETLFNKNQKNISVSKSTESEYEQISRHTDRKGTTFAVDFSIFSQKVLRGWIYKFGSKTTFKK